MEEKRDINTYMTQLVFKIIQLQDRVQGNTLKNIYIYISGAFVCFLNSLLASSDQAVTNLDTVCFHISKSLHSWFILA